MRCCLFSPFSILLRIFIKQVDNRSEWILPALTRLAVSDAKRAPSMHETEKVSTIKSTDEPKFKVVNVVKIHQLSLEWEEKPVIDGGDFARGFDLCINKGNPFILDGSDTLTHLLIIAYSAIKLKVKRLEFVSASSLKESVVRDWSTLKKLSIVAPFAKRVTLEGWEFVRNLDLTCPSVENLVMRDGCKLEGNTKQREDCVMRFLKR